MMNVTKKVKLKRDYTERNITFGVENLKIIVVVVVQK